MIARYIFNFAKLFLAFNLLVFTNTYVLSQVDYSKQRDFVISGSDGYGTQECLIKGDSCGKVLADSWCSSKGFKSALAYRKLAADEITGSYSSSKSGKEIVNFLVSCRE